MSDILSNVEREGNRLESIISNIADKIDSLGINFDSFNHYLEESYLQEMNEEYEKLAEEYQKQADLLEQINSLSEDRREELLDSLNEERKRYNEVKKEAEKNIKAKTAEINSKKKEFSNNKVATKTSNMGNNFLRMGKQAEGFGKIGAKVGKSLTSAGNFLSKGATKLLGPIGLIIDVLNMFGKAAKEVAEARAELMKFENERNAALVDRNVAIINNEAESLSEEINLTLTKGMNALNIAIMSATGKAQVANMEAIASVNTKVSNITEGYNAAAWKARNSQIDIEATKEKNSIQVEGAQAKAASSNIAAQTQFDLNQRKYDIEAQKIELDFSKKNAEINKNSDRYAMEHGGGVLGAKTVGTGESFSTEKKTNKRASTIGTFVNDNTTGNAIAGTAGSVGNTFGVSAVADIQSAYLTTQEANADRAIAILENNIKMSDAVVSTQAKIGGQVASAMSQVENAVTDATTTVKTQMIDAVTTVKKSYAQATQTVEKWIMDFEKNALFSGTNKGLSSKEQLDTYKSFLNKAVTEISQQTGMQQQEIIDIQNNYASESGRSLVGNMDDMKNTAYLGKYIGSSKIATDIASQTEIFNMGMSDTMEMMWHMTKKVNKMGLDGKKYLKDMVNNLKMAQKYNFKGGVKGMMEIAKWAQNVRFDMNKLPALVDNLLDGGLEGSITKAAQLQVLGGNFAMGADPLAMMYEAIDDPGALAQRYADMLKGQGSLNYETGAVDFKGVSNLMLHQAAKVLNMDVGDLKKMAGQSLKREKMGNILSSDLDEEQQSNLINKAYMKDGEWMVNDINNNAINVKDINKDNIANIQPDNSGQTLEESVQAITGWLDREAGLKEAINSKLGQMLQDNGTFEQNQKERYNTAMSDLQNPSKWLSIMEVEMGLATQAFKTFFNDEEDPINKILQTSNNALAAIDIGVAGVESSIYNVAQKLDSIIANSDIDDNSAEGKMREVWKRYDELWGADDRKSIVDSLNKLKDRFTDATGNSGNVDWAKLKQTQDFKNIISNGMGRDLEYIIKDKAGLEYSGDNWKNWSNEDVEALFNTMNDGVVSSNGNSMITAASNVTPIHDGSVQLAKSDPKDTALFAKAGGPFDTLFNGIFAKINEVSNILPKNLEYIMPLAKVVDSFSNSKYTPNNDSIKIDTIKIELNGKLELSGSNGQSVDILSELQNNPILLRSLTQLIGEAINKNINGGKSTYNGGVATPRFNSVNF